MANQFPGLLRTHFCGELDVSHLDSKVKLCGWMNKYRDLGGLHFIDLRDKQGVIQLSFENWLKNGGDADIFKKASHETVIQVDGTVRRRPESAINEEMKTGKVELDVSGIKILSEADRHELPFLPTGLNQATEDLRLKFRYLDLRTERLQSMLQVRSEVSQRARPFYIIVHLQR